MPGEDLIEVVPPPRPPNVLAFTLLSTCLSGGRHAQHWTTRTFTLNSETTGSHFAPHVVFQHLHKFCRYDILLAVTFSRLSFSVNS